MTPARHKGFWSYARHDASVTDGKLAALHRRVCAALGSELGIGDPVDIFMDEPSIKTGHEWEKVITERLAEASFLIAIVTPSFFSRKWCCKEKQLFREQERRLGCSDLIFPIEY